VVEPALDPAAEPPITPLAALLVVSPERKRAVLEDISHGSVPRPLYYLLLMVSGGIAAFGLLANSAAVVIGAMLVSPLMTPIFGISLALSRGDLRLLRHALIAEVGGIVVIIVFALLLGLLPFALEVTPEMMARTRPTLLDLFVATLAGLAGGLAMVDERTSPALPGVAIATSLTPPLATSGLSLAFGAFGGAWGAFLLFFANFLAILTVSAVVFVLAGFVTRAELGSRTDWMKRFAAAGIGLVAVTALLTRQLVTLIADWRTQNTVVQALTGELANEPGASLLDAAYRRLPDGQVSVLATVRTPQVISPETVKAFQDVIASRLEDEVVLFVRCSITKDVTAAGSVALLPEVDLNGRFVDADPSPRVRTTEIAEQVLRQLVSNRQVFALHNVDLLSLPSGPVLVASVEGARAPAPAQVEFAQNLIRERVGDPTLVLVVRSVTTTDVTAKGRILLGQAHFSTLSADERRTQAALESRSRAALTGLSDTYVEAVDAALEGDRWVVRAAVAAVEVPRAARVAAIEQELTGIAGAPVALSVLASTDLIVTGSGYDSVAGYIQARAVEQLAAQGSGAPARPPADAEPIVHP
jgi:uncharacterized hydrophobic protein (TIGR00271 family)